MEAAEKALSNRIHASTSLPRENKRKEPLGQANNSTSPNSTLEKENKCVLYFLLLARCFNLIIIGQF